MGVRPQWYPIQKEDVSKVTVWDITLLKTGKGFGRIVGRKSGLKWDVMHIGYFLHSTISLI